jgi:hypothetical protein
MKRRHASCVNVTVLFLNGANGVNVTVSVVVGIIIVIAKFFVSQWGKDYLAQRLTNPEHVMNNDVRL